MNKYVQPDMTEWRAAAGSHPYGRLPICDVLSKRKPFESEMLYNNGGSSTDAHACPSLG